MAVIDTLFNPRRNQPHKLSVGAFFPAREGRYRRPDGGAGHASDLSAVFARVEL